MSGFSISRDQELMSAATNYRSYLYDLIRPYVSGDILEVGAGIGNMTEMVLRDAARPISSMTCVEADPDCAGILRDKFSGSRCPVDVLLGEFPGTAPNGRRFDLVYHYNVLEHIKDDALALTVCHDLLKDNGIIVIYVPAFQILYGSMDRRLAHYRRYSKSDMGAKLVDAGFTAINMRYCNFIGFWAWFYNNRVMRIKEQKSSQVFVFDKILLPLQRRVESLINLPLGQNLCVVARKRPQPYGNHV